MTQLARTPRAPAWPIVGSAFHYLCDPLGFFREAARRGSIVDLRLPTIVSFHFSDPADIEHVVVTANKGFVKDLPLFDLRRALGDGLLTSEGELWRRQRRVAQPAFHRERIRAYAAHMVAAADAMLATFREGEVRDVHSDLMRLTLNIVVQTLFSSTLGSDEVASVGSAVGEIAHRYEGLIVPWAGLPTPGNVRFRRAVRDLDTVVDRIVARRRAGDASEKRRVPEASTAGDLLSMLMEAQTERGEPMPDALVRDEIKTMIVAGHETTANALAWALLLLAQNPGAADRLFATVRDALGGRLPSADDLPKLAYAEHVVSEAIRLYPPAWVIGREVVEPFELRGIRFPKKAQIFFSQWAIQRDARHFDEPDAFRPDRWADGLARRLPRFAYFPFGGGPRVCIGNVFAMTEATLILAVIAQRYRFEPVAGLPVTPVAALTLRPRHGLFLQLKSR